MIDLLQGQSGCGLALPEHSDDILHAGRRRRSGGGAVGRYQDHLVDALGMVETN